MEEGVNMIFYEMKFNSTTRPEMQNNTQSYHAMYAKPFKLMPVAVWQINCDNDCFVRWCGFWCDNYLTDSFGRDLLYYYTVLRS